MSIFDPHIVYSVDNIYVSILLEFFPKGLLSLVFSHKKTKGRNFLSQSLTHVTNLTSSLIKQSGWIARNQNWFHNQWTYLVFLGNAQRITYTLNCDVDWWFVSYICWRCSLVSSVTSTLINLHVEILKKHLELWPDIIKCFITRILTVQFNWPPN